jgi:hypothetical protein
MERAVALPDTPADRGATRRRTLANVALVSTCASIGAILALGRFQSHHNADSVIPILVSLYRWTPYYWEQDRFGMLVPLLCGFVRSPFDNLLVQSFVTITGGIAAIWTIGRYFSASRLSVAVAIAVFTATAPTDFQFFYLGTAQPYNISLLLAFGGLCLLGADVKDSSARALRRLAGFGLLAAATWVNAAILILLAAVVVVVTGARAIDGRDPFRTRLAAGARAAALNGISVTLLILFVLSTIAQRLAPFRTTWIVVPPVDRWSPLIVRFAVDAAGWMGTGPFLWLDLAAVAVVAISWKRIEDRRASDLVAVAAGLLMYGCVLAVLFSGRGRYFVPAFLILHTMVWMTAVECLRGRIEQASAVAPALFVVACLAAVTGPVTRYGWPSRSSARTSLAAGLGQFGADALDAGATHIIGDYWTVWPAVFEANVLLHERGAAEHVMWGVTFRSRPTESRWRREAGTPMLLAAKEGDPEVLRYFGEFRLGSPRQVEQAGSVVLFERR